MWRVIAGLSAVKKKEGARRKSPGSGVPEKYDGGGEVELNPKLKKIPILGQFGTLKKYIHIKHGTLKNIVFFLFKHRHIQENYSCVVRLSRHYTLHIHVVNLCFI